MLSAERLIDNLSTSIIVVDKARRIIFINQATENLLSTSFKHVEGMLINEVFAGSTSFLNFLEEASVHNYNFSQRELELVLPANLRVMKVDCSFNPIADEQVVLVELIRVDKKLRIAKEENIVAQQSVLKQLVRGLAHEVKNPLGGIRGAAQLLERELESGELKEYTDVIIGETDRLQKLVDDMLGPNRPLKKEPINIHRVLERVRQVVMAEDDSKDLSVVRDYDPSLPEITADQDQLIQATLNIVRNAKQALQGKGKIVLRTRSKRKTTIGQIHHRMVICVEIIDNGPGISSEMIEQIFYPMVSGRVGGTGLGLSIAQTLIGQHGGIIECSSKPGETIFTMLLPLENEQNGQHV